MSIRMRYVWLVILLGVLSYVFFFKAEYGIGPPAFSPAGEEIVFSFAHRWQENLYQIRKDGTGLKKLTDMRGAQFYPAYSPDGKKIVFSGADSMRMGAQADLYIMNADGTDIRPLTAGPDHDIYPVFSPGGERIYFVRARRFTRYSPFVPKRWHDMDLYSIKPDGTDLKDVTWSFFYSLSRPSFFPNGKEILIDLGDQNDSIWKVSLVAPVKATPIRPNLQPYLVNKLAKPSATEPLSYNNFSQPIITPNGKFMLFVWGGYYQGYAGHEIYRMETDTKRTTKLTDFKGQVHSVSLSHDNQEIVFLLDRKSSGKHSELWIMNTDGTDLRRIDINL